MLFRLLGVHQSNISLSLSFIWCHLHNSTMNFLNYIQQRRMTAAATKVLYCVFLWWMKGVHIYRVASFVRVIPLCMMLCGGLECVWRCQRCDKFQWNVLSTRHISTIQNVYKLRCCFLIIWLGHCYFDDAAEADDDVDDFVRFDSVVGRKWVQIRWI